MRFLRQSAGSRPTFLELQEVTMLDDLPDLLVESSATETSVTWLGAEDAAPKLQRKGAAIAALPTGASLACITHTQQAVPLLTVPICAGESVPIGPGDKVSAQDGEGTVVSYQLLARGRAQPSSLQTPSSQ